MTAPTTPPAAGTTTVVVESLACAMAIDRLRETLAEEDLSGPVGPDLAEKYSRVAREAAALARLAEAVSVYEQQRPDGPPARAPQTPPEVRAALRVILEDITDSDPQTGVSGAGLTDIAFELHETVKAQPFPDCEPISQQSAAEMHHLARRAAALALAATSAARYMAQRSYALARALEGR